MAADGSAIPDQPANGLITPPLGVPNQITLQNLSFPWLDLAALGVSPDQLTTNPQVQLALAHLVGQKDGIAHMVAVDEAGNVGISSPRKLLGTLVVNENSTDLKAFPVPAGTQWLHVIWGTQPGPVTRVAITGVESAKTWVNRNPQTDGVSEYYVPFDFFLDFSVLLSADVGAGVPGAVTFTLEAMSGPPPSFIQLVNAQPIPVIQPATLAPALAPRNRAAIEIGALAVNGTTTLVAGVANQRIYLHELEIAPDAAAANFVEVYQSSTPGTHLWQAQFNQVTPRRFGCTPAVPIAVGDGLVLKNDGASAGPISLRGTIAWSQA